MTMERNLVHPVIRVADPDAAAGWMRENLFFRQTEIPNVVENGTCRLEFVREAAQPWGCAAPGQYHTGPEHVALRTGDIRAALEHCRSRGIEPNLPDGQVRFNPKVYGGGEYYFNFMTPFGLLIEISQRLDQPHYGETALIQGLDHIGVPSENLEVRMKELTGQGFGEEFAPVHNYNDQEGNILCCMMRRDDLILEVYQFADMTPSGRAASGCLTLPGVRL